MSNCIDTTSFPFPVTLDQGIRGSKGKITEKYYLKVIRCGTAGSYTFETEIYRKGGVVDGWGENEQIGMTHPSTGEIVWISGKLEPLEEAQLKKIKNGVKQALKKAKKFPIGNADLTHAERTAYLRQLGFQNVAEGFSSNPTGFGQYASNGVIYDASTNEPVNTASDQKPNKDGKEKEPYEYTYVPIDIEIKGDRRKSYGNYYYPEDLSSNRQDRVRFTQKYSQGTKIEATLDAGVKQFQRKKTKIKGSVTLPIVTGIEDTNRVDWQGATLNPIQALGASGALGVFQGVAEGQGISEVFGNAAGAVRNASMKMAGEAGSDIRNAINVYLAQRAVGAQGLLSRATGAVLNPNLEMLFGGPSLRNFAFTFTLSPRDAEEADQVRKILRFFKQGMSVKTTASNVFLKAPNVFDIQYQTFNTEGQQIVHPSINIIKTCALLSCNVQYTPNNTYMTYEDPFRTMTAYQLTLSFGELDPIYDNDYKDLDKNQDQVIGY